MRLSDFLKGQKTCCFNPRTRTGCDLHGKKVWRLPRKFQSTHPHGVRLKAMSRCTTLLWSFNPRTRMGCDSLYANYPRFRSVSIHAPARGATVTAESVAYLGECFNPRTRTGCDILPLGRNSKIKVSIHAPARGATEQRLHR